MMGFCGGDGWYRVALIGATGDCKGDEEECLVGIPGGMCAVKVGCVSM